MTNSLTTVTSDLAAAFFDGVDLRRLAQRIGTPFHAYSASLIRSRIAELQAALRGLDALVCFAVKANPNTAILRLVGEAGLGADIVSAGELYRALHAGIAPQRIVFSGVGKRDDEIDEALAAGIARFNVESRDELGALQRLAEARGMVALASVRINPDVDALTHAKISTGRAENKFGVAIDEARRWFAGAAGFSNVRLNGLHVHIGSQILSVEPFRQAFERIAAFRRELEACGHAITSIDVGGGLGVRYRADDQLLPLADYVAELRSAFAGYRGRFMLEPGRWLVAEAGLIVTRVLRVKHGEQREFLVLDAAMNDLQRPSLYDAWHEIIPIDGVDRPMTIYDVVGPVCETGDTFARDRALPACAPGDLVTIRTTGAYGASMASTYNSRPLAAEVMLDRGRHAIVRQRQTFAQMIAGEASAAAWETA